MRLFSLRLIANEPALGRLATLRVFAHKSKRQPSKRLPLQVELGSRRVIEPIAAAELAALCFRELWPRSLFPPPVAGELFAPVPAAISLPQCSLLFFVVPVVLVSLGQSPKATWWR